MVAPDHQPRSLVVRVARQAGRSEDFYCAAEPRCRGQPTVCSHEGGVDCLGERYVARVVGGEVLSKLPYPPQQGGGREHHDGERREIRDGRVGLIGGQVPRVRVPAQNRNDLDPQQVRSSYDFSTEPIPESDPVTAGVGNDRREDRRVKDEHVPRRSP